MGLGWVQAAQAQARGAEEAAARHRDEAKRAVARVAEVESEMCALLAALERQKRASASKVQQLAHAVRELQAPMQAWHLA